jgi:hypothetical protein
MRVRRVGHEDLEEKGSPQRGQRAGSGAEDVLLAGRLNLEEPLDLRYESVLGERLLQ